MFNKSNDFEGLGHKIHNNLNGSLFNGFSNGKISNVHLEVLDNNKYSFDYGGGMFANSISNARVVNVHVESNSTSAKGIGGGVTIEYTSNMGGLFGTSNNAQLFFCSTDLNLRGRSELGGLIGHATDTVIQDSYSYGKITGISTGYKWFYEAPSWGADYRITNYASQNVGGLVGQSKSTKIVSSIFIGSVQYVEEEERLMCFQELMNTMASTLKLSQENTTPMVLVGKVLTTCMVVWSEMLIMKVTLHPLSVIEISLIHGYTQEL